MSHTIRGKQMSHNIAARFAESEANVRLALIDFMALYVTASAQAENSPLASHETQEQRDRLIKHLDKRHRDLGKAYRLIMDRKATNI